MPTPSATAPHTQVQRMHAAIDKVVAVGPGFLRGEVDVQRMTDTMIGAVRGYAEQEKIAGGDGMPHGAEAERLHEVLRELYGCGTGFQADRCDAACVARTITYMVDEFGAAQG
ncbi:MAG: hypothetical protein WBG44_01940 [Comamonas sp.]|jgi:hypothetical protein|nr:hypothetical protein [Comamonas sp.]MCD6663311.1 hypothetical protein [Comamonas sp.]